MNEVSINGTHASDLELRALCRIHDVRAVIVPQDPNFAVASYHHKQGKRVIALYYTSNHFDLLLPATKGQPYPADLSEVVLDPEYLRWTPRPVIVTIRENRDNIRVL